MIQRQTSCSQSKCKWYLLQKPSFKKPITRKNSDSTILQQQSW